MSGPVVPQIALLIPGHAIVVDLDLCALGDPSLQRPVALTDDATVSYLVSATFAAEREHGINPLDEEIGLEFPESAGELLLSPKDTAAPSLAEAAASGLLPSWDEARAFYASLAKGA